MTQVAYPIAPPLEDRNGTLLESVEVTNGLDWLVDTAKTPNAPGLFESYSQMSFGSAAVLCGTNNKTFANTPGWVDGFFMAAYGGVKCNAVGGGIDADEVRRIFEMGESTAVEAGLMDKRLTNTVAQGFAAVNDITPAGGAVKPKVAIALIEGWMSRNYVGQPLIHLPVVIGSLVMGADGVALEQNVLRTKLGAKVIVGAGYDYPNKAPAGTNETDETVRWVYGTGGIAVRRGDLDVRDAFNQSNNEVTALAERGYIVAVDGPVVAIKTQVSA